MKLYGYWRSSAAYRVRIALNLKQIQAEQFSIHLVKNGGEQHSEVFRQLNPQSLVPALSIAPNQLHQSEKTRQASAQGQPSPSQLEDEQILTQSLAIVEYLDEAFPAPSLLPQTAWERAQVRSLSYAIACDIHPLNNLRVLQYLTGELGVDEQRKNAWYLHWIQSGFAAIEQMLVKQSGQYCFGDQVTMADICLIPQVYNAERFYVDMAPYPHIQRVYQTCNQLDAFINAQPERQADAI